VQTMPSDRRKELREVAMFMPVLARLRYVIPVLAVVALTSPTWAILFYTFLPSNGAGKAVFSPPRNVNPADVAVPPGYCVEPVVTGLTYPTAAITDEKDRVYVLESGYSYGEDFAAPRLLRVEADG